MELITVYKLIDGSVHNTSKAALNYCEEQMGAEVRDMLYEIGVDFSSCGLVNKSALKLVIDKKFDKAIFEYAKWRNEHNEILEYLKEMG